jgi:hypothetical protein
MRYLNMANAPVAVERVAEVQPMTPETARMYGPANIQYTTVQRNNVRSAPRTPGNRRVVSYTRDASPTRAVQYNVHNVAKKLEF